MENVTDADSLAYLHGLASDPPKSYKRVGVAQRPPVILYIFRVPGKRDICLSVIRPERDSVTPTDVFASMYYVRFDDERTLLVREQLTEKIEQKLRDKDLEERDEEDLDFNGQEVLGDQDLNLPRPPDIRRKPVPKSSVDSASAYARYRAGGAGENDRPRRSSRQSSINSQEDLPYGVEPGYGLAPHTEPELEVSSFMTLIRRDITNGRIDEVARMFPLVPSDAPPEHFGRGFAAQSRAYQIGPAMSIDMLQEGYSKFEQPLYRDDPTRDHTYTREIWYESWDPKTRDRSKSGSDTLNASGEGDLTNSFRTLEMMQEASAEQKEKMLPLKDRLRAKMRNQHGYVFTSPYQERCVFASNKLGDSLRCVYQPPSTEPGRPAREIVFSELRFNFPAKIRTMANKRSTSGLPSPDSDEHPPPLPPRHAPDTVQSVGRASYSVEDTRPSMETTAPQFLESSPRNSFFSNFRSRNRLSSDISNNAGRWRSRSFNKSTSSLGSDLRSPSPSVGQRDTHAGAQQQHDPDRLDLSLGQEALGGGFDGEQAKLGKIIVHEDGFKMLDLLIASNVLLWYKAFESAESNRAGGWS